MFDNQKLSFSKYTLSRIFVIALIISFLVAARPAG